MRMFDRISTILKSNVNDMISKAEDPEKMINQLIMDMQEQFNKAKSEVAVAIAEEKKLQMAMQAEEGHVENWIKKAELAVSKGDDQLALEALGRKKVHTEMVGKYRTQYEAQKGSNDSLRKSLKALGDKIEDAKREKGILVARAKRAEAQESIQSTVSDIDNMSAFDTFDRMADKVGDMEARAEASAELNKTLSGDDLEKKFDALESSDDDVMDELEALKAKMNK